MSKVTVSRELFREYLEQAHMAGQIDAGVDPGYSNARVYADRILASAEQRDEKGEPAECHCPQHGNWKSADDINRLVRELDVALNGDGAAKQASLCDVVAQVKSEGWRLTKTEKAEQPAEVGRELSDVILSELDRLLDRASQNPCTCGDNELGGCAGCAFTMTARSDAHRELLAALQPAQPSEAGRDGLTDSQRSALAVKLLLDDLAASGSEVQVEEIEATIRRNLVTRPAPEALRLLRHIADFTDNAEIDEACPAYLREQAGALDKRIRAFLQQQERTDG